MGEGLLPKALAVKYPNAGKELSLSCLITTLRFTGAGIMIF